MSIHFNRAKNRQEENYIANSWKFAVNQGWDLFFQLDRKEVKLSQLLLQFDSDELFIGELRYEMALLYCKVYEIENARPHLEQAKLAFEKHLAIDDLEIIDLDIQLAKVYIILGLYDLALGVLEGTLFTLELQLDNNHLKWLEVMELYTSVLTKTENYFEALKCLESILKVKLKHHSSRSRTVVQTKTEIGIVYRKAEMLTNAIETLEDTLDNTHPTFWPLAINLEIALANTYAQLSCGPEGMRIIKSAINKQNKYQGYFHTKMALLLEVKGQITRLMGDEELANKQLEGSYHLFWQLLGPEHYHTERLRVLLSSP